MADVYDNARHRKHLARLAHSEVKAAAERIAVEARRDLAEHRDTGASRIDLERAGVDYLVSLVDPGAMTIEYGRAGGRDRKGRTYRPQEGKHILGRHL